MKKLEKFLSKIFGGLNITWPRLIIFAVIMGAWTALMAMFVPERCSLHDIAVTPEWWVLPAMLIIVNSKKPLEAALKTFVFFLISQPLVYLIQVPFNSLGWGLFGYYRYWFMVTLLTFPAAFVCWFIKKDKWYSGVILAGVLAVLALFGVTSLRLFLADPPFHLLTTLYCFVTIVVFIFALLKDKIPRIIASILIVAAFCIYISIGLEQPFETYNNIFLKENNITFVGAPYISFWAGNGRGAVELIQTEDGYAIKMTGDFRCHYQFDISDDEHEYHLEYFYDPDQKSIVIQER
ncbi:hypothetical protein IJI02_01230 [Candidatus Saccharibacteria bacterium]|nr:hypothetical protein [Candidatus Saccharibacteria bacterium]